MLCTSGITMTANFIENMRNLAPQPLKTLYLHHHNAYGHQTWQVVDLPWDAHTHEITWIWSRGLAQSRDTKNITTVVPLATCFDGLLPTKSHDAVITWSCKVTRPTNCYISIYIVSMVTKLDSMVTYLDGLLSINYMTLWSHALARLCENLKPSSPPPQYLWSPN